MLLLLNVDRFLFPLFYKYAHGVSLQCICHYPREYQFLQHCTIEGNAASSLRRVDLTCWKSTKM